MNKKLEYNNHILTDQEREQLVKIANETIAVFSDSIDGIQKAREEFPPSENTEIDLINNVLNNTSVFICYSFADYIVLTKLFLTTHIPYEKSLLRGKLKVQLNESFKKLYGFTKQAYKESYCCKLEGIMHMFPGFKTEFDKTLADLDQISKRDSWWKEVRNAEVHIDIPPLYESRHEEINESKVVMETMELIDFFIKFNDLIARMGNALINHMWKNLRQ